MTQQADAQSPTPKSVLQAHPERVPDRSNLRRRPLWLLAHLEEILTALLLGVMLGSVGLSVFCRYVLQSPLSWTEEVVLLCMVWLCFLGASIATKHKEHIAIDIVVTLLPRPLAKAVEVSTTLIVIGILGVVLWQGIRLLEVTQYVTTTALGIPTMYMYAAVPASALLMLIHNLRILAGMVRRQEGSAP